jgi:uncharacterized membrane protein
MLYPILKWLHVLSAIVAVGSNVTYGIWLSRAAAKPETLPFTLRGIKTLDDRLANPSYGLLLVTGLLMVFLVDLPLTTPWLLAALVLYVLLVIIGLLGYTPTLRNQIRLAENPGPGTPEYQAASRLGVLIGIVLAVLAVAIVFLMVVKPSLWAG